MRKRMTAAAMAVGASAVLAASPASAATGATGVASNGALSTNATAQPANLAAGVGYVVGNKRCYANGITFTARTYENGFSGVHQFAQQARLQEFTTHGWINASGVRTVRSQRFPDDRRNFSFTLNWRYTHPINGASWRVLWKGYYLNGAGRVIRSTPVIRVVCA